jgi:hypothetical protein
MRSPLAALLLVVLLLMIVTVPSLAQTHFRANLDGNQVVNPSGSTAAGFGCFVLNPDNTLDFQISYVGLLGVETGAHIHGPAPAGVNAGVQFPLPAGNPKIGTVGPLTAVQAADLVNGLYYVQIHTTLYPGGEIRGQILTSDDPCTVDAEETTWGAIKSLYR